ncbi:MAG: trypsin-like peptidase domain-containing protein [Lamprocystis purpurea]|nr:trypsin-like peptidase domain-containing protein [Lamprocystis purpurea]
MGNGSHVVTNWHVVACTAEGGAAAVLLAADREHLIPARVLSHDEHRDLAVLKTDRGLGRPAVHFAPIASVRKLDRVVAYGFPGAADDSSGADMADPSVTSGVAPADPDRCGHQPRQLGRTAVRCLRPGDRGQYAKGADGSRDARCGRRALRGAGAAWRGHRLGGGE